MSAKSKSGLLLSWLLMIFILRMKLLYWTVRLSVPCNEETKTIIRAKISELGMTAGRF